MSGAPVDSPNSAADVQNAWDSMKANNRAVRSTSHLVKVDMVEVKDALFQAPVKKAFPLSPEWQAMKDEVAAAKALASVVGTLPPVRRVETEGFDPKEEARLLRSSNPGQKIAKVKNLLPTETLPSGQVVVQIQTAKVKGSAILSDKDAAKAATELLKAAKKEEKAAAKESAGKFYQGILTHPSTFLDFTGLSEGACKKHAEMKNGQIVLLTRSAGKITVRIEVAGERIQYDAANVADIHVRAALLGMKVLAVVQIEKPKEDAFTVKISYESLRFITVRYETKDEAERGCRNLLRESNSQGNAIYGEIFDSEGKSKAIITRREVLIAMPDTSADEKKPSRKGGAICHVTKTQPGWKVKACQTRVTFSRG